MFRYTRPKSSMWGHWTGRQPPAAFRHGVAAFLQEAAASYETTECSLQIVPGPCATRIGAAFVERLLNDVPLQVDRNDASASASISRPDFETCLDWLMLNADNLPPDASDLYFALNRHHSIHAWGFPDSHASRSGSGDLVEGYGSLQYVGTHPRFQSLDEYRWVKEITRRTLRIQMNDNHLRGQGPE